MDHTTTALIQAIEFLLTAGHIPALGNHPDRWTFQEDSEIHLVLVEALQDARCAIGMDMPIIHEKLTLLEVNS